MKIWYYDWTKPVLCQIIVSGFWCILKSLYQMSNAWSNHGIGFLVHCQSIVSDFWCIVKSWYRISGTLSNHGIGFLVHCQSIVSDFWCIVKSWYQISGALSNHIVHVFRFLMHCRIIASGFCPWCERQIRTMNHDVRCTLFQYCINNTSF